MATLTVSLPDTMVEWIEDQVGEEFADKDAYVSEVIARDRQQRDDERLDELRRHIDEALASGVSTRSIADIRQEARRLAHQQGLA